MNSEQQILAELHTANNWLSLIGMWVLAQCFLTLLSLIIMRTK